MCSKPIIKLKRRQKMIELNKVTASIVVASTVLIATIGILIYRDIKHERQIDNLTKQHNILQANLNDKIIDISVKTTSKLMETKKNKDRENFLKLRKACEKGFNKLNNFFNYIGIDITKSTPEKFYNYNKEKLDILRELLKDNHTPQKENTLGTNGTKDNETAPKLNKKTK